MLYINLAQFIVIYDRPCPQNISISRFIFAFCSQNQNANNLYSFQHKDLFTNINIPYHWFLGELYSLAKIDDEIHSQILAQPYEIQIPVSSTRNHTQKPTDILYRLPIFYRPKQQVRLCDPWLKITKLSTASTTTVLPCI